MKNNSRYNVGFDKPEDSSSGVFCVWDRKKNTLHKIIETRFVGIWLFWFKIRGIKVLMEIF